jgi:hypothetical protein
VTIKSYEPIPINMPPQPDIKKEQAREEGNWSLMIDKD